VRRLVEEGVGGVRILCVCQCANFDYTPRVQSKRNNWNIAYSIGPEYSYNGQRRCVCFRRRKWVGVFSIIGYEDTKGNEVTQKAFELVLILI